MTPLLPHQEVEVIAGLISEEVIARRHAVLVAHVAPAVHVGVVAAADELKSLSKSKV